MRPPSSAGLLLRYRGRKLRVQRNGNKRFVVKASLDANSVLVVVAVTAFSALSLAYYNRYINSNIKNSKKITSSSIQVRLNNSEPLSFSLCFLVGIIIT